jgi:Fungal N-terminal domain of STAND proteins
MAEVLAALGVVASVAQLADYGFRLSVKLYSYSAAVSRADKAVQSLSNEVSVTSAVLKELGGILQEDEAKYVSVTALQATSGTVQECLAVFEELNQELEKCLPSTSDAAEKAKFKINITGKLKFPFMEKKIGLLRANLDRLKSSLTLMLQVLSYGRDIVSR